MRGKLLRSLLLAFLLVILPGQVSFATPTAPYVLVNESTKECYVTIMGDECYYCQLPAGWKILNASGPFDGSRPSCPAGYIELDHLDMDCPRYKSRECCGIFMNQGDCEDLVMNPAQRLCAFVDDINGCVLPEGWIGRPTDVSSGSWLCRYDYSSWVDNVPCLAATSTPAPLLVVAHVSVPRPSASPAIGLGLIALGGGLLLWIGMRRRR